MYCNVWSKNRKSKKAEISYTKKKVFLLLTASVVMNMKNIFKEKESIEISKILASINNIVSDNSIIVSENT